MEKWLSEYIVDSLLLPEVGREPQNVSDPKNEIDCLEGLLK